MADDRSRNKAESSPELPPIGGPGIPDPPPSPTSPALDSAAQARPGAAAEPGSDYEIIHPIGRGSYGEVYLARDAAGAYRAVKVIFRESFEDDRPFQREYEGIRKFVIISRSYENQVQIFHVGRREQPNQFYYIMELADDEVNGRNIIPDTYVPRTLRSELKRRGRLPAKECLNIGVALTLALEDLHENGLVHRDVKPGNIIFVNHRPKLADIGLVTDTAVTVSYVGTEGFIAPEGPGSPAADLYSLGKVLYEMCTGRDRLDFPELPADFMALPDRELLLELNTVIARACERDPRKRYQTARELREDLHRLQRGISIRARRARRRTLGLAAALVLAIGIPGVIGFGVYDFSRTRPPQPPPPPAAGTLHSDTQYLGTGSRFWSACFSPDGRQLVTAGGAGSPREVPHGGEVILWDLAAGKGRMLLQQPEPVRSAAWSPDGTFIAIGDFGSSTWRLDPVTGKPLGTLSLRGMVNAVAVSADNTLVVSGTLDGMVSLWNVARDHKESFRLHDEKIISLALSRDRRTLVAGASKGLAYVFNLERRRRPRALEAYAEPAPAEDDSSPAGSLNPGQTTTPRSSRSHATFNVETVAFAPDGTSFATGCRNRLRLWETATGKLLHEMRGGNASLTSAAFSPDGKTLATIDSAGLLVLWDPATSERIRSTAAHAGTSLCVNFSPDGQRLVTVGRNDFNVKIWDAHSFALLVTLQRTTLQAQRP